jgi:monoamine oxidase
MTACDVCVVGAGYAGLSAARRLAAAGREVIVLEARDRVGGRVWTQHLEGTALDVGGTFIGPGQDEIIKLAADLGVALHPTYHTGDSVISQNGALRRFSGLVPRINPIALAGVGLGMAWLNRMARTVPLDEPWTARRAAEWDAQTAATWLSPARIPSRLARELLGAAVRGCFTADPGEVSLLHVLYLIRSAGSLETLLAVHGGYQQDQVTGGAQQMAERLAADLGDAVRLDSPVRGIRQTADRVSVVTDTETVDAARVVVAIPPALTGGVRFEPSLPTDRALLHHRMPAGSIMKAIAVYDEPFWRHDGLSGESMATGSPIELTLDCSPPAGPTGVLTSFVFGPHAQAMSERAPDEQRRIAIDALAHRFGPRARSPVQLLLHNWADEQWTRGCSMAHFPPGVLTTLGHALRAPVGRIHWAGTETATVFHGTIDGAVRSGQRAADEVLERSA